MAADVPGLGPRWGPACWSGSSCVQGSVGNGLAQCHHITQVQQPAQDRSEAQLILLRDHILAFFINKLVKKFLKILSVKRVTESETFSFLK